MGVFSRLKDLFSKKSIDSLKEVEQELNKLQKKSNSEIIALLGIHGRLKGLPLIYISKNETDLRRISAQLTELLKPLKNIYSQREIQDIIIRYMDSILYYRPLMKNVSFFAIVPHKNNLIALQQWINSKREILEELFHSSNQ